ncbi:MAG: hypothetical protein GXY07_18810 [Candidatus Hydrogenedentes bacterium]|nr:hypothetical protein [Candidatus Hydrogenedentota bacterium]
MTMIRFLLAAVLLGLAAFPASAASFKAAAAKRIITPDPLLPVSGGVGTPEPATQKQGELWARALVFEQGGTRVALVSIDNLGWPHVWGDKTRALVPGIPPQNILIAATHTHSAPDAYGFPDETGKHHADLGYLEWACKQTADAINEAVANLQPAALKIAVGEAKGKIAYNYYAPQLYDPRCSVLQAVSTEGAVLATLVNYAIHPEVLGDDKGIISPDLCGPLYDRIESKGGGMALFMNGAQGGMVTADNRGPDGDQEIWEECVRIGKLLADEAMHIVADAPLQQEPSLLCAARDIHLTVSSVLMQVVLLNSPLAEEMPDVNTVPTRVNLVNIGSAQILTIPGEALPNIGYYLKRHMKTPHTFLFGLTNDAYGYMLTKYDFNSFKRYEYISETSLGEMAAEEYMEQALGLIEETPGPDAEAK